MKPLISIIIPCYNQGEFLSDAINSALEQSYRNIEIIVIDDGSTDNTAEIASNYGNRIHYTYQDHKGVSAARNRGMKLSRGECLQFLDSDDKIERDKILYHAQYLEHHPETDIVYGDVRYFTTENPEERSYGPYAYGKNLPWVPELWRAEGKLLLKFVARNLFAVNCPLVRRRAIEIAGEWNEDLRALEDWEYWARCVSKELRFQYIEYSNSLALVRIHPNSMTQDKEMIRYEYFNFRIALGRRVKEPEFRLKNFLYGTENVEDKGSLSKVKRLFDLAVANSTFYVYVLFLRLILFNIYKLFQGFLIRTIPWPVQKIVYGLIRKLKPFKSGL